MKRGTALLYVIITAFLPVGCNNYFHDLIPPDDTLILSFEVEGQLGEAVISADTVMVTIAKGTDVNALVPRVRVSRKAEILPVTLDYVSAAFPGDDMLKAAMQIYETNDKNKYVMDMIKANPGFNVPEIIMPIDFTGPVPMLVIGGMGSIKQYTVYIVEDSGEPRLLNIRFSKYDNAELISDAVCVIDEAGSAVYANAVYPMDMDYLSYALIPSFNILGDSLEVDGNKIDSGVGAIRFSPVLGIQTKTITITREGASRDYTLTVLFTEDPDTVRSITDFRFNKADNPGIAANAVAAIVNSDNTGTITVQVYYSGAKPPVLAPRFISPGIVSVGNVTQTSGADSRDFSSPVEYRVVSKNRMYTRIYTVKVEYISVTENAPRITAFWFSAALNLELVQDAQGQIADGVIYIDAHYGGDSAPTGLMPEFNAQGLVTVSGSVQVSGASAQNFTRQVKYTVTNPLNPNLFRDYWVQCRMLQDSSSYAAITSFGFYPEDNPGLEKELAGKIDQINGKITVYAPAGSGVTERVMIPRFTAAGQVSAEGAAQVSGVSGRVFDAYITYTVVSPNGSNARSYTVNVRELKSPLYVNCNAYGYGDGSSWEHAFTSLRTACEAAAEFPESASKEIWIAAGTYTPGRTPEDCFPLTANTSYIGGFAGWETDKSQRNIAANTVIISGDLGGGAYTRDLFTMPYTVTTIETAWGTYDRITYKEINGDLLFENLRLENSSRYGVYCSGNGIRNFSGITAVSNIGGSAYGIYLFMASGNFTLTGGRFTSYGVACSASGPVNIQVTDTEIRGAKSASGLHVSSGSGRVSVDRVTINGSSSGLYASSDNSVLINNSTISNCSSTGVSLDGLGNKEINWSTISGNTNSFSGGGLYVNGGGTCTMNNCTISNNNTGSDSSVGGGIDISKGTFIMNGGTISGNKASYAGGGVYVGTDSTFIMRSGASISGNIVVNTGNCFGGGVDVAGTFRMEGGDIYGNSCTGYGGGVTAAVEGGLSVFIMSGGSIYSNTSGKHGGGVYAYGCKTFSKTGGTIYGSNGGSNANRSGNNSGHAAYKDSSNYKNDTLGPSDNLSW